MSLNYYLQQDYIKCTFSSVKYTHTKKKKNNLPSGATYCRFVEPNSSFNFIGKKEKEKISKRKQRKKRRWYNVPGFSVFVLRSITQSTIPAP